VKKQIPGHYRDYFRIILFQVLVNSLAYRPTPCSRILRELNNPQNARKEADRGTVVGFSAETRSLALLSPIHPDRVMVLPILLVYAAGKRRTHGYIIPGMAL
jgi:hypothetical protein